MLNIRTISISFGILLLTAPVIAWSRFDYVNGGHGWRQGDWLINFGDGPIRRGLIGEFLIFISDTSGLQLLLTTQLFQVFLFLATAFVFWQIALRHRNPGLLLFLAASPAFFLIFFAANPMGSMRKEVFGILALSLLVLDSLVKIRPGWLPALSVFTFTVGCIGNVLHSLMLPVMLTGLYFLYAQSRLSKSAFLVLSAISAAMALFWMTFAIVFNEVTNLDAICRPLLVRDLNFEVCNDAIRWLVTGEVAHSSQVVQRLTLVSSAEYIVVFVFSIIPLLLGLYVFFEKRLLLGIIAISFLPLLPLYLTATDWGRWLSISYTASILLIVQAHAAGRINYSALPRPRVIIFLIGISLLVAPEHSIGWKPVGALASIVEIFRVFI